MTELNINDLMGGDRRQFYRVAPSVEEPIVIKIAAGAFPLIEISGGGCRLPIAVHSKLSDYDILDLCLPGKSAPIKVKIRFVNKGEKTFSVEFVDLDTAMREEICSYVRAREIELVRRFRAPAVMA